MAIREEAYVYGNTVRQPRVSIDRQTALQPSEPKRVSKQVHKNRNSVGYEQRLCVVLIDRCDRSTLYLCQISSASV